MRIQLPLVKVIRLGRIGYNRALQLQTLLQQKLLTFPQSNTHTLLLLEHNPVYTLGFREKISKEEIDTLTKCGAEVVKSDRGGLTTFHGPGQLVAYPILDLKQFRNLSLRKYVSLLEMSAIHTCRMLGTFAVQGSEGIAHTGAWVNNKKICAIGVHCKRYVTTHGLALNCSTDLEWFKKIIPCGIVDKGITSLSNELSRVISIDDTIPQFLSSFQSVFLCRLKEHSMNDVAKDLVIS